MFLCKDTCCVISNFRPKTKPYVKVNKTSSKNCKRWVKEKIYLLSVKGPSKAATRPGRVAPLVASRAPEGCRFDPKFIILKGIRRV